MTGTTALLSSILLLAFASPAPAPSASPTPASQQEVTTKKVCQTIEIPTSRMPKRVCQTVVVKKLAPKTANPVQPESGSSQSGK